MEWIKELKYPERLRRYIYADKTKLEYNNVTHVGVSKNHNHRLQLKDGTMIIVAPGWRAIESYADGWSF